MAVSQFGWTRETTDDPLTYAGYTVEEWRQFNTVEQNLLMTDALRTEAQQNYYIDYFNDPVRGGAYVYTGLVDYATGMDSAQSADTGTIDQIQQSGFGSPDDTIDTLSDYADTAKDYAGEAVDFTKDVATIALVAGAYLLLKR